ncbi:MAG: hypothetical protein LBS12_01040, partial [Prevotellaceae bacterium]|nr:hypothetical protein [Prevotellaceae bacterium]
MKGITTGTTGIRGNTGAVCGQGGSGSIFLADKRQPTPKYRQNSLADLREGEYHRQNLYLGRKAGSADGTKALFDLRGGSA